MSNSRKTIKLNAAPGAVIANVASRAIAIAKHDRCVVELVTNRITLRVNAKSTISGIVNRYHRRMSVMNARRRRLARATVLPVLRKILEDVENGRLDIDFLSGGIGLSLAKVIVNDLPRHAVVVTLYEPVNESAKQP